MSETDIYEWDRYIWVRKVCSCIWVVRHTNIYEWDTYIWVRQIYVSETHGILEWNTPLCVCHTSLCVYLAQEAMQPHTNCLFCRDVGLFCGSSGDVGLFCGDAGLFCGDIGLLCADIGLFCGDVGLFGHLFVWSSIHVDRYTDIYGWDTPYFWVKHTVYLSETHLCVSVTPLCWPRVCVTPLYLCHTSVCVSRVAQKGMKLEFDRRMCMCETHSIPEWDTPYV